MFRRNLMPWRSAATESEGFETAGSALTRLRSDMDRLFDRFFSGPFFGESWFTPDFGASATAWWPTLDVKETDEEVTVHAEIPGVDRKDLDISISGDVLTISGEKKEESERKEGSSYRAERRFGAFRRSIPMPASVDPEKISAEYDHGILTVRLRKSEAYTPRRIPVKVSKK